MPFPRKQNNTTRNILIGVLVFIILAGAGVGIFFGVRASGQSKKGDPESSKAQEEQKELDEMSKTVDSTKYDLKETTDIKFDRKDEFKFSNLKTEENFHLLLKAKSAVPHDVVLGTDTTLDLIIGGATFRMIIEKEASFEGKKVNENAKVITIPFVKPYLDLIDKDVEAYEDLLKFENEEAIMASDFKDKDQVLIAYRKQARNAIIKEAIEQNKKALEKFKDMDKPGTVDGQVDYSVKHAKAKLFKDQGQYGKFAFLSGTAAGFRGATNFVKGGCSKAGGMVKSGVITLKDKAVSKGKGVKEGIRKKFTRKDKKEDE